MSSKKYLLILFICFFTACGAPPEPQQIILSGTVGGEAVLSNRDKPILVLITMNDDFEKIEEDPENYVIDLISVDKSDLTFSFDLSDKGLHEGDKISIAAYVDVNYNGSAPIPDEGDFIGVFADEESTSASYELKAGENTGIHIDINREIFSFEASVEGIINGNDAGMLTLIIYTGELNSSDFSDIDYNGVIGYKKFSKSGKPESFELDVLPFGHNVPIENVYVFALLDVNENDIVDAGDKIGYYSEGDEGFPALVTINEGVLKNIDIDFQMDVDYPPADGTEPMAANEITLNGSFLFPEGYGPNSGPGYVIITGMANPDDLLKNAASSVKYFEKLPPGATDFTIDLSATGLNINEEIMILGLWDRNHEGGFPNPNLGDFIGFYSDMESMSTSYKLKKGINDISVIKIDREIFSFDASVSGNVISDIQGDVILIAYSGDLDSSDFSTLDTSAVVGYSTIEKENASVPYTLTILPYGQNIPMDGVYIFALLDANRDGSINNGDKIGFYAQNNMPAPLAITEGDHPHIDIEFHMDVTDLLNQDISLNGTLNMPPSYGADSPPVYFIVAPDKDPEELLNDPASGIKYFEKIPTGETSFNINLSGTDLKPGDEVMLLALWDLNFTGGFPNPDNGDFIGFYINTEALSTTCTLEQGGNQGLVIDVNREIFDFEVKVEGTITGEKTGDTVDILVLLYAGEITSFDFSQIDYDKIIGFKQIHEENLSGDTFSLDYTLPVLPFGMDIPIENTFVIAFLDNNGNGAPDGGDSVGFYSAPEQNGLPSLLTINNDISGIDIQMSMELSEPCPGNNIIVNGRFTKPDGYDAASPPIFLMVAKADDPSAIFSDNPMNAIKYFCKMPAGENYFLNLDLSQTGLCPEDEVILLAMFDKDYTGGFPNPTQGDVIGYLQNKNAMSFSIKLEDLQESIDSDSFEFELNKIYYEHHASIEINLTSGLFVPMGIGDQVILIATQSLDDMDYVVGMQTVRVTGNTYHTFTMLPVIYEGITIPEDSFEVNNVYIAAILDTAEENGMPDNGEYLGYYQIIPLIPATVNIKEDVPQTINVRISTAKYNQ